MYTNRFITALIIVALAAGVVLTVQEAIATSAVTWPVDLNRPHGPVIAPVTGAESRPYIMDSATRSYIAWGKALEAAGKLGDSGACSTTTPENLFAARPDNLDSATRSYIAWGLALQAKDDTRACR